MSTDEYGIFLDWYEKIEQKFSTIQQKQKDLTVKLDDKIKEAETNNIQAIKVNQSLPLSMI